MKGAGKMADTPLTYQPASGQKWRAILSKGDKADDDSVSGL